MTEALEFKYNRTWTFGATGPSSKGPETSGSKGDTGQGSRKQVYLHDHRIRDVLDEYLDGLEE